MNQMMPVAIDRSAAAQGVKSRLSGLVKAEKLMTDPVMTYAYSGDASTYRLVPAIVVIVDTEEQVRAVIEAARAEGLPLTFRAAGTSLSGQAITDGVLCVLGDGWKKLQVLDNGDRVLLGPANIVANVNKVLKPYNRKLGPDPASQATCKIGGVVNNNSSGMCCGVAYNTYHTLQRMRLMLVDGTILDTGDANSVAAFRESHVELLEALHGLHHEVTDDDELVALIRRKYRIKNTVGYSINALIDFHDPIDILVHLIVGSEGTLGFVSEVTYRTIPEHPFKATDLVVFPDPHSCARAISRLANNGIQSTTGVVAAEYMERRALKTFEVFDAIKPFIPYFTETSPAVLIDVAAPDAATLEVEVEKTVAILREEGATHVAFSTDEARSSALWDVRKGAFAIGGAARPPGTSFMTEDVAAPIDRLADFVIDLRKLLDEHGYLDATIVGHALAGNLHFVMSDDFSAPGSAEKFDVFNQALADLVSIRYGGSLKAEHGTGRAIAPFVEAEWGEKAYRLMQRIKPLFDPEGMLNPGVMITPDRKSHIHNLKVFPLADPLIDKCIECGFCEPACPSLHLTMSPRQRIVLTRERARLAQTGEDPARLAALDEGFQYPGLDTCAACNLCSLRCPVGIETGTMIIGERGRRRSEGDRRAAHWAAEHTGTVESMLGMGVGAQALSRKVVGNGVTDAVAGALHALAPRKVPRVSKALKPGPGAPKQGTVAGSSELGRVVYFPACPSRMFGAPTDELGMLPATEAMLELLSRAGFQPVVPEDVAGQCCGQAFQSKGFPAEAKTVGDRARAGIDAAAGNGQFKVVTDASTCAKHLREHPGASAVMDSAEFLRTEVLPRLKITAPIDVLAVHHNCSAQRLKEQSATEALARAMAKKVVVLDSITCCGFAGDKGLYVPELNAHATRFAKAQAEGCEVGISTVSTCATGLSERVGVPFVSIASLLEKVSR